MPVTRKSGMGSAGLGSSECSASPVPKARVQDKGEGVLISLFS